jgi:hypothetical protein
MPQMGIASTSLSKGSFGFVWPSGGLGVIVINNACHSEFEFFGVVRARVFSSKAMVVVDIKALATVECPNGRGGAATLACANNRVLVAVGVEVIQAES